MGIRTAHGHGQPALAAIGKAADRCRPWSRLSAFPRSAPASCSTCAAARKSWRARPSRTSHPASMPTSAATSSFTTCRCAPSPATWWMPEINQRQQADPATDPVRSCRDRQAFWRDPGIRCRGTADHRRLDAGSGARRSQRRGVFQGSSRPARRRPVHQPPDAASRRLCHRAQPAHHRRRRTLSRRGRGLDPLFLFSRSVRPPASRPRRHHHRVSPRRHRDHAHAVRPRHDRQEPRLFARRAARAVRTERIIFGDLHGQSRCRGSTSGATAPGRWSFWSESPGAIFSDSGAPRRPGSARSCWR